MVRGIHPPGGRFRFSLAGSSLLLATALSWWLLAGRSEAAIVPLSPPSISGTAQVGQTLDETHASWSQPPVRYTYQWSDCNTAGQNCHSITGAIDQSYQVVASDIGYTLRVQETAFGFGWSGRSESSQTAVVAAAPPAPLSSATSLMSLETSAVADQPVTLIATVTSGSAATPPAGTLSFENAGAPISGCQNEPISPLGQSVTVTCQTSFPASVAQLSAVFTPSPGSGVAGSASVPIRLTVQTASTATAVTVSSPTVRVHGRVSYTAIVRSSNLAGALEPSGSVGFFDRGKPVRSCAGQPLTSTGGAAMATCRVRYRRAGQHLITARYLGDANFAGSTSSPAKRVDGVAGSLHPILSWTFYYAPRSSTVLGLTVAGVPPGARVRVTCVGRGCPLRSAVLTVPGSAHGAQRVNLAPLFGSHRLKPRTVIAVSIQRPGWIGRRFSFVVRPGHAPRLSMSCRAPGLTRAVACQA